MSWVWDGVDDQYDYGSFPLSFNDALTMLALVKITETDDTTWESIVEIEAGGATRFSMGRRSNGTLYYGNNVGIDSAGTLNDSLGWVWVAVTRTAAAATSYHIMPVGGSRTTSAGGALADGASCSGGTMTIGGPSDPFTGKMACYAYWPSDIGTANLDTILAGNSTATVTGLTPHAAYDASDGFVADLMVGFNRTADVGTTEDTGDNPAGYTYAGAGPPAATVKNLGLLGVG